MQNKNNNQKQFRKRKKFNNLNETKSKPNLDEEINKLKSLYGSVEPSTIKFFWDLPLSQNTIKGLKNSNYKVPTDIQRESIGFALEGRDILGAAITGSGKTLAFLIPVLEKLFIQKWSRSDGVGAIIISPTRELAYQIFETLKKIGTYHDFSAGLIIGGKNLKFERSRMDQCNIVICTPGRLLQHMDENPLFNSSTMQILILDEADRCLDMGFADTMNGIIENLPTERQTMLYSATQTKSVKDLARLSLKNPAYVAPHEQQASTPENLQQNYVVIELEDKITMLWSFIKNHLKQKTIIFLSTCKQVKYIYEIFCKLRPGTSLLALYGTLHQDRRVAIYNEFCRKSNVVLFATDIASRGLDFPIVNWVIQLDCPEDGDQYIHRAGRTARHKAKGESLLVLLPNEETGMLEELSLKKITINQIHIDPRKMFNPKAKMEAHLAANKELKESAQRALISYIKSVVLMKNKNIFNVEKLDIDAFSSSLGLALTPRVRFLEKIRIKKGNKLRSIRMKEENRNDDSNIHKKEESETNSDSNESDEGKNNKNIVSKIKKHASKIKEELNSDSNSSSDSNEENTKTDFKNKTNNFNFGNVDDSSDEDDDLLKLKRKNHKIDSDDNSSEESTHDQSDLEDKKVSQSKKIITKAAIAKRVIKKKIIANKKVTYNEDGEEMDTINKLQSKMGKQYLKEDNSSNGIDIETAKKILQEEDIFDKQRFKELVKAKHKDKKKKLKKQKDQQFDEFGSDDEDYDVDLSWLPDPDKIYGEKKDSSDEDADGNKFHKFSGKLFEKPISKRKLEEMDRNKRKDSSSSEEEEEIVEPIKKKAKKIANKLSVDEAELLAMKLISN